MKQVLSDDPDYKDVPISLNGVEHRIFKVPGLGDCLYHSLIYLLYANEHDDTQFTVEKSHLEIREELVELTEKLQKGTSKKTVAWSDEAARKDFLKNVAAELKEMRKPRGWGSEVAMRVFVEALPPSLAGLQIWFRDPDDNRWKVESEFRSVTNFSRTLGSDDEGFDDAPFSGNYFKIAHVADGYPNPKGKLLNHFCPLLPKSHVFDDDALDPAVSGSEVFLDGLDEDEDGPSESEVVRIRVSASRSHATATKANTFDTLLRLPMIDIHCHVGGKSISGGMPWLIDTAANKFGKIGFYGLAPESRIIRKIINRMRKFCWQHKFNPYVAGNAVILDFAYTPLNVPTGAITAVKAVRTVWRGAFRSVAGVVTLGAFPIYKAWEEHQDPHKGSLTGVGTGTEKEVIAENRKHTRVEEHHYYTHPDDKSPPTYLWIERDRKFYERSLNQISEAVLSYPGELWPFVGFDPRRADGGLEIVKKYTKEKGFVGVKLYSRTGWMPVNNQIIYGEEAGSGVDTRLQALYDYVLAEDLPMLVHTSPTGFPPDGPIVLPWNFIQHQREHRYDGKPNLNAGGQVKMAPWPPAVTSTLEARARSPELMIRAHAGALALFCLYNQWTTSPYSWEPVLEKHKNLRLNMAHFGAEIGTYATPRRGVVHDEDWNGRLKKYPYVAGTAKYGDNREGENDIREFNRSFKHGVLSRIKQEVEANRKNFPNAEEFLGDVKLLLLPNQYQQGWLEKDAEWGDWLTKWEAAYPLSWHDKIRELLGSNKYKNLYTDIAYLTARDETSFQKVFLATVDEAIRQGSPEATLLGQRLMIGTDWFMTEMDGCTPDMFWNYALSTFDKWKGEYFMQKAAGQQKSASKRSAYKRDVADDITEANLKILWRLWSSENSLRYLNLGARLNDLNKFYDKSSQRRPVWWKDLEKFYANDWQTPSGMIPIDYQNLKAIGPKEKLQAEEYNTVHAQTAVDQNRPDKYQKAYTDKGDRERQAATGRKAQKQAREREKQEKARAKAAKNALPDFKSDTKGLPAIPPGE